MKYAVITKDGNVPIIGEKPFIDAWMHNLTKKQANIVSRIVTCSEEVSKNRNLQRGDYILIDNLTQQSGKLYTKEELSNEI